MRYFYLENCIFDQGKKTSKKPWILLSGICGNPERWHSLKCMYLDHGPYTCAVTAVWQGQRSFLWNQVIFQENTRSVNTQIPLTPSISYKYFVKGIHLCAWVKVAHLLGMSAYFPKINSKNTSSHVLWPDGDDMFVYYSAFQLTTSLNDTFIHSTVHTIDCPYIMCLYTPRFIQSQDLPHNLCIENSDIHFPDLVTKVWECFKTQDQRNLPSQCWNRTPTCGSNPGPGIEHQPIYIAT